VGGLPYSLSENELYEVFAEYGEITSCNIIIDKFSGQSKGFGFVEYSEQEMAKEAVKHLDGSQLNGRTIKVSEARPRSNDRSDGGGGNNRRNY